MSLDSVDVAGFDETGAPSPQWVSITRDRCGWPTGSPRRTGTDCCTSTASAGTTSTGTMG